MQFNYEPVAMSRYLVIEEMRKEGPVEVGRLETGQVLVGREPDIGGIAVSAKAVSRNHGIFIRSRNHWFFKDLDSTNGSWVNGVQVKGGQWKLVRSGTMVQLADLALRLVEVGGADRPSSVVAALTSRSVIVFSKDGTVDEFPIPEYGKALMIGGSQGDLPLLGDVFELPSLVVERRGDRICAYRMVKNTTALNGEPLTDVAYLKDGDTLEIGDYQILFNDPSAIAVGPSAPKPSGRDWASSDSHQNAAPAGTYGGGGALTGRVTRLPFGQAMEESNEPGYDETVAMDPSEISSRVGRDSHPSMRYSMPGPSWMQSSASMQEKLILFIGLSLFLILGGLVIWWVWL